MGIYDANDNNLESSEKDVASKDDKKKDKKKKKNKKKKNMADISNSFENEKEIN